MNAPISIQRLHRLLPLADTAPAYLFFGGSFDPPHIGHATLPAQAAECMDDRMGLAVGSCRIVYVPAGRSPHKDEAPTADEHRLAMLNLALADLDRPWTIWDQELSDAPLNLGQPSYWADTWAIANQTLPNSANRFLIGADQALSMHRWHRYTEFWKSAVVMMRGDSQDEDTLVQSLDELGVWSENELIHWRSCCVSLSMAPWSSTGIRAELAVMDRQRNTRIEGLDPGVQSYIFEHGLYV